MLELPVRLAPCHCVSIRVVGIGFLCAWPAVNRCDCICQPRGLIIAIACQLCSIDGDFLDLPPESVQLIIQASPVKAGRGVWGEGMAFESPCPASALSGLALA